MVNERNNRVLPRERHRGGQRLAGKRGRRRTRANRAFVPVGRRYVRLLRLHRLEPGGGGVSEKRRRHKLTLPQLRGGGGETPTAWKVKISKGPLARLITLKQERDR